MDDLRRRDAAGNLFCYQRLQLGVIILGQFINLILCTRLGKCQLQTLQLGTEFGDFLVVFIQRTFRFGAQAAGFGMPPQPAKPQHASNNQNPEQQRDVAAHFPSAISLLCFKKVHRPPVLLPGSWVCRARSIHHHE